MNFQDVEIISNYNVDLFIVLKAEKITFVIF